MVLSGLRGLAEWAGTRRRWGWGHEGEGDRAAGGKGSARGY